MTNRRKFNIICTMNELKNDFDILVKRHNVIVNILNQSCDENWYDADTKQIHIAPVADMKSYLCALHEVGHFVNNHEPTTWDEEVLCEIEAWEWTYKQSCVEVLQSFKDNVESNRLKGSWE